MRGIVSAMAIQPDVSSHGGGMLAAGTFGRWVGLYDAEGSGGTVANWCLESGAAHHEGEGGPGGLGVTQVLWSPCGRYLMVVERMSGGVLVYDVRVTGKLVGWLGGRQAKTNQRLGVDVAVGRGGECEVWAGGTDGVVNVWEGVGMVQGRQEPAWGWKVSEGRSCEPIGCCETTDAVTDVVSSVVMHPSGGVVATSSGQRRQLPTFEDSESEDDEDDSEDDDSEHEGSADGSNSDVQSHSTQSSRSTPSLLSKRMFDNSLNVWAL